MWEDSTICLRKNGQLHRHPFGIHTIRPTVPRSDAHGIRKQHPSPKPPALMKRLIEFFTKKGGRVLDPFVGVGGTLLACSMTGRHGVGIDLSQEYLEVYHQASAELGLEPQPFLCGDARDLENLLGEVEPFDLILTDPPMVTCSLGSVVANEKRKKEMIVQPLSQLVLMIWGICGQPSFMKRLRP